MRIHPNHWNQVKLGDLVDICTGKRDANHGSENGKFPFFTCAQTVSRIDDYSFDTEAVLVAGNGDFNVKYFKGKFDAYQRTYILDDFKKSTGLFIYYKVEQALDEIMKNNQGSSVKFIKKGDLTDFEFSLPPLHEQKKIAQILTSVDEDIQATQKVIDQTTQVKKGLMEDLFTKGIGHTKFKDSELRKIPESWVVKELQEIASVDRGKFSHRPRNDAKFYNGSYPFIQTGDVVSSKVFIDNFSQSLNEKGYSVSRQFPKGTIVMTIAANIGDVGILSFDSCFPDSLVGITANDNVVDNGYLYYFLYTQKEYLNRIATQSAQKNINLQKLNPLNVIVPPIDEQKKISSSLLVLDEKISIYRDKKLQLRRVKKGLMQDLLSGNKLLS